MKYYQDWRNYRGAVSHMLRFYCKCPDATIGEMTMAAQEAWFSCHHVMIDLPAEQQEIIRVFFTQCWPDRRRDAQYEFLSEQTGLTEPEIRSVIENAVRLIAIDRGLADK